MARVWRITETARDVARAWLISEQRTLHVARVWYITESILVWGDEQMLYYREMTDNMFAYVYNYFSVIRFLNILIL